MRRRRMRDKVFAAVEKIAGEPEEGLLLLRVCRAISEADGEYAESERRAIEELAKVLNLPPELLT